MEDSGAAGISRRIAEDAGKEAAEIVRKAGERVAERLAEARGEADQRAEDIMLRAREDAALEARRAASRARLESRKIELRSREAVIAEVMRRTADRIAALRDDPGYGALLERLVASGARDLGEREIEIAADERDRRVIDEAFLGRVAAALEGAGAVGSKLSVRWTRLPGPGVIIRSAGGRVEVDNTVEARIARRGREIRLLIAKALFGDEAAPGER